MGMTTRCCDGVKEIQISSFVPHFFIILKRVFVMFCLSSQSLDLVAFSADVANIWVTGLRYLLAHPSIVGGGVGGGGVFSEGGLVVEGSLGGKMRSDWLSAEFAQVDEDGYGIVSEDVAVTTICKLCPGIKEAKVREESHHSFYRRHGRKAETGRVGCFFLSPL